MARSDSTRDVAIIGMACRFADAESPEELWSNVREGRASFRPIPAERWNHEDFASDRFRENDKTYVREGAFIEDVDSFPALWFGIAPRRVEVMDPQHRMVLETTRRALEDAGLERGFDTRNVGTFLGVSTSEYRNLVTARTTAMLLAGGGLGDATGAGEALSQVVENVGPISAFSMPGNLLNMAAANVANQWKLGGPAFTIDAACASSLVAIHDAVTHIRSGICDAAIAGGVYLNLTPESIIGFSRIGAISQRGACRPFDAEADGFLQGDGCGIVVLKSYDKAVADGDRIWAVIRGSGINNDAGSSSGPMAPSLDGQIEAVSKAWEDAQLDPTSVGFVSCHGTATPVGDPVEVAALKALVGDGLDHDVYLGSVKGNIGHTMSAAGVAGLIHAVMALHHGEVAPQAGFETPHSALDLEASRFRVPTESLPWPTDGPRRAGVSAFGFGGTNCHLVIEEPEARPVADEVSGYHALVLTAGSRELLSRHAMSVADALQNNSATLTDVAFSLNATRKFEDARLVVVVDSRDDAIAELRRSAERLAADEEPPLTLGPNAFWGHPETLPKVGFLFPGQGAQRVGLLRDLYERFEPFAARLDALSEAVEPDLGRSVVDFLYPSVADEAAEEALTATEVCQPVMAVLGLALAQFLVELGVEPEVVLGHSLGEFAAAGFAGLVEPHEALRFVARRGRLMADLATDDFGAMAAVMAGREVVEPLLDGGASIANLNHPSQTVISGTTSAVDAAIERLNEAGHKATRLRVSHAFHSPVVAAVVEPLRALSDAMKFGEPRYKVVSAISGEPYGSPEAAREVFAAHATSPVDFMSALRCAVEQGVDTFIEVGAGTTLTSFAQGTVGADLRGARSLGAKAPDDARDFHRALAMLVALGLDVDFGALYGARAVVALPATPLQTSRHWVVREKKVALEVPEASKRGEFVSANHADPKTSSELVALFREQNEILRQHAEIMARQTAILGGEAPDVVLAAPEATAPRSIRIQEPAVAPPSETEAVVEAVRPAADVPTADYEALVFEAVAGVSAFPADALSFDQELAADLGFDSLMFVDLGADLQKRVPGLAIPQTAFGPSTTVGDLVEFLKSSAPLGKRGTGQRVADAPDAAEAELRRWAVDWAPAPRTDFAGPQFVPSGSVVITIDGEDREAEALADALRSRGADVRVTSVQGALGGQDATCLIDFAHRNAEWSAENVVRLTQLAAALCKGKSEPEAFVVVSDSDADAATRGALRGFAKALAREWPAARVVSVESDAKVAANVVAELDDPTRYSEVRWIGGSREVPQAVPATENGARLSLAEGDVVLITGGARGIGASCARSLVEQTPASVVLVGSSEASHHTALLKVLGDRGSYVQWDVTKAAGEALSGVNPRVIVHAAGVIRDGKVEEKQADDVRLVTSVKVDGLRNVLKLAGSNTERVIGFGSWSGRFGNARQTDYAAANDAMTEILRDVAANGGPRAVNIDWPLWNGSAMVETIPEALREMMRGQGVTFMSADEGVEVFLKELGGASSGEVIFGREVAGREAPFRARMSASVDALPYVADHVLRDVPVLPFATALDWMTSAAKAANDGEEPLVLRDVQLFRGIELDQPKAIAVHADIERGRGEVVVYSDDELAYRASASFEPARLEVPEVTGATLPQKFDIDTFYREHSFHGPKIRGISRIDAQGEEWVVGWVKTSTPSQLLESATSAKWTTDPLVIDATMQLVLYQLQSLHGVAAFPTGIDEFVQLRPFVGSEVKCTMVLDEMAGGNIVGSIAFEDDEGLAAMMVRLRAREFDLTARSVAEPKVEVDPKYWDIKEFPEVKDLQQRLQMAELIGIRNPYFWPHTGPARNVATIEGREMINFSSYNYCGFSGHPLVSKSAIDAVEAYGTSVSASRIASGQIPLHQELEDAIASFIGTEASLVFSAGHMTNETCIGHLFGKNDLIIHDSLAHNSILTGAELSGAKRMQFPHSDYAALDKILRKIRGNYQKVGIFIEGVYSMDGDIPDLAKFIEVKRRHSALLYVDEAHSMGVIGPRGAGISDYFGIDPMEIDVWMGTLSKSFASCGGYITGSKELIEYLKYTAPAFVFSAGISPANAGAALASVSLLAQSPEIPQTLQKRAAYFLELCAEQGIDTGMSKDSAVVPCIVGNSLDCLKLSQRLAERGINVQPIVYPAVEDESSRLRFFLSSTHTEDELQRTVEILTEELHNVRSGAAAE